MPLHDEERDGSTPEEEEDDADEMRAIIRIIFSLN